MSLYNSQRKITITCSHRLVLYLEKEVRALGFTPTAIFKTGIELKGTLRDCIQLNIHLRCASQVLFFVKSFTAYNATDLYNTLRTIQWESMIDVEGYFSVTSNVQNETITNPLFANVKVKDAIVDYFRDKFGKRPDSGQQLTGVVIYLYWKNNTAEVFIDTSGGSLSKHGYRKIPGKAPMMESLAAAIILAGEWDGKSPFVNPMCGSGTLAIEAAMMATNRVPGLYRDDYAFMHLSGFDDSIYHQLIENARSKVNDEVNIQIVATDISEDAVAISKVNAGIAGVAQHILFKVCDFTATPVPVDGDGVIYFNPEYGDRLGEEITLQNTYAQIGDFMKKECKGYIGYVFTGNLALAKKVGLRASKRIEFFNGKIDCRLLQYELYAGSREK